MQETDKLRIACPECGKRLRIKPALEGKRLKCPSCSTSFQAKPDNQEENERPRKQARETRGGFPWITVVGGTGAALLLAFLAFLLLGAKSEARNAKVHLATSAEKLKDLAAAKEDATKRIAMAERKAQELAIEIGSVEQKLGPLQKTVKDKDSTIERLTKDVAAAKQEAETAKKKIENLTEELAAAKKAAAAVTEKPDKSPAEPSGKIGQADTITEAYKKTLKDSPPPNALAQCVLATQKDFRLEAALLEVKDGHAKITVVTKEANLPDGTWCLFLCLRQGAKPAGVADLINNVAKLEILAEMSSDPFTQGLLRKSKAPITERVTVFEGSFGAAGKAVDPATLDYEGYVAIQICRNRPGSFKTASNPLWVKVSQK